MVSQKLYEGESTADTRRGLRVESDSRHRHRFVQFCVKESKETG